MAITGVNSCNNVYEATYASQKTKYAEISEQKKVKEAEEARKNAENLTERIREKTAKKKKELKISIEKAADENKEKEKMAERDKNTDKVNMGKAEQFLAGKTRQTKNGEVYLDTGDMQIIMEAVKEEWVKDEKTADETGANLDMKI